MSLLKVNEIQIFNGTTVTITATTTETSADLNVGADLDVTGALTLGTALAVAEGGTGATDAATARTNLDVDQAGTDNSTDVSLVTTSHDYLSITGQAITLGPIDLAADVTGSLPYASISGTPTLGTAAAEDVGYFATAAQGALADSAVQPGDDADTLGSGAATDGYVLTADGAGGTAWEAASGGAASLPINLLSSGASIRKSDGTTAVLSESSGAVTLENVTNLEADSITDKLGTGAPDLPNGLTGFVFSKISTSAFYSHSGGGSAANVYEEIHSSFNFSISLPAGTTILIIASAGEFLSDLGRAFFKYEITDGVSTTLVENATYGTNQTMTVSAQVKHTVGGTGTKTVTGKAYYKGQFAGSNVYFDNRATISGPFCFSLFKYSGDL